MTHLPQLQLGALILGCTQLLVNRAQPPQGSADKTLSTSQVSQNIYGAFFRQPVRNSRAPVILGTDGHERFALGHDISL